MKINLKKSFSLLLILPFLLTACNSGSSVQEIGKVNKKEEKEYIQVNKEADLYKQYKVSKVDKVKPIKDSWYYRNVLTDREKFVYSEVKTGYLTFQKEIDFSKPINEDSFIKVMNIIYFDTPELMNLGKSYSYKLDINNNVLKLIPSYSAKKEDLEIRQKKIEEQVANIVSQSRDKATSKIISDLYEDFKIEGTKEGMLNKEYEKEVYSMKDDQIKMYGSSPLANSLKFSYFLKERGIDSFVKLGVLTTDEFTKIPKNEQNKKEYSTIPSFVGFNKNKLIKKDKKDDLYTITMDQGNVYTWVVAKIEGQWYNLDPGFDYYINERIGIPKNTLKFASDYILSYSRIFNINEELLGITPPCNNVYYMDSVGDKGFILSKSQTEMNNFIDTQLESLTKSNKESFYNQFENSETMDRYIRSFEAGLNRVNEKTNSKIHSYKMIVYRPTLSVYVYKIIYK